MLRPDNEALPLFDRMSCGMAAQYGSETADLQSCNRTILQNFGSLISPYKTDFFVISNT